MTSKDKKDWLLFGRSEAIEAIHFAAASLRVNAKNLGDESKRADEAGQWERKKASEYLEAATEKNARVLAELHRWLTS